MFEDNVRITSEITITTAEYIEIARKALKYDLLKNAAKNNKYLTEFERAVYEIDKEAEENVDE
ncbi:MAG: hypothetical protein J6J71_01315 [Prevotella sp.]|nr:hypothetical protein [Prevotella sp.]